MTRRGDKSEPRKPKCENAELEDVPLLCTCLCVSLSPCGQVCVFVRLIITTRITRDINVRNGGHVPKELFAPRRFLRSIIFRFIADRSFVGRENLTSSDSRLGAKSKKSSRWSWRSREILFFFSLPFLPLYPNVMCIPPDKSLRCFRARARGISSAGLRRVQFLIYRRRFRICASQINVFPCLNWIRALHVSRRPAVHDGKDASFIRDNARPRNFWNERRTTVA